MRRTLLAVVVILVAVTGAVSVGWAHPDPRPALDIALSDAPAGTLTASFTDWQQVREVLAPDIRGRRAPTQALFAAAYERDLSAVSVLGDAATAMPDLYGWSVLDTDWEMYAQSDRGAAVVLAMSPGLSPSTDVAGLRSVGYDAPAYAPDDGGVWVAGNVAGGTVSAVSDRLLSVAVLADQHIIVASNDSRYAAATIEVVRGEAPAMTDVRAVTDVAAPVVGSAVAVIHPPTAAARPRRTEASIPATHSRRPPPRRAPGD